MQVFGFGTVDACVQSNVGFKVAGVPVTLNADEGDLAPVGSVLAKPDDRDVRVQPEPAHATTAQADAHIGKTEADVVGGAANLPHRIAVDQQATVLVVTHDETIFNRFDRLIYLRNG